MSGKIKLLIVTLLMSTMCLIGCGTNQQASEKLFCIKESENLLSSGKIQAKESQTIDVSEEKNIVFNYNNGDSVEKGAEIYSIEDEEYTKKLNEANNELSKLRIQCNNEYNKVQAAYSQVQNALNAVNNMSQDDPNYSVMQSQFQDKQKAYESLKDSYNNISEAISQKEQDVSFYSSKQYKRVYADISGIFNYNDETKTISINSTDIVIKLIVKEKDYNLVKEGEVVKAKEAYKDGEIEGTVISKSIIPVDNNSGVSEYTIIIDIPDTYVIGTSVEVTAKDSEVKIPLKCVEQRGDNYFVYVVRNGNQSVVQIDGAESGDYFLVDTNISEVAGQEVLVNP